jgi:hypothetical protein
MPRAVRWLCAAAIILIVVGPPVALYRAEYVRTKRFHEVTPGRFYRSGQMTEAGIRETVDRYNIKLFINLQHENPDPILLDRWLGKPRISESHLCRELNVRYVLLTPDILPQPNDLTKQPPAVTEFLKLLDDESNYPVLIHCKAGLHRTGRLTAIYRMEYQGWDTGAAMRELKANGYGFMAASEGDDFIIQFVQNYHRRSSINPFHAVRGSEGNR